MTRQEAIARLKKMFVNCDTNRCSHVCKYCDEAINMAIEALQQEPIIRCEDCKHHGTSNCPMWGNDTTEDYMWCCNGERMESDGE